MREYAVFALVASMGSFGGPAGHARRGSGSFPGRSAILGLLGAALGVRRDDAGQDALKVWKIAVAVLDAGWPLRDFHTAQAVPGSARSATRAEALATLKPGHNPVLTRRDYRVGCAFGVAVWGGDCAAVVDALRSPAFVPYMGRKSCPLSAPMAPRRVEAEDAHAALASVVLPPFLRKMKPSRVISDEETSRSTITETFWDDPADREKWHFAPRTVYVSILEETT